MITSPLLIVIIAAYFRPTLGTIAIIKELFDAITGPDSDNACDFGLYSHVGQRWRGKRQEAGMY
jgi:hypothetical protein